jgi:hypothetical protein
MMVRSIGNEKIAANVPSKIQYVMEKNKKDPLSCTVASVFLTWNQSNPVKKPKATDFVILMEVRIAEREFFKDLWSKT